MSMAETLKNVPGAKRPVLGNAANSAIELPQDMTTTGTVTFNPSLGELVLNAYSRIGIRRTSLLASHLADARIEANLLQAE
jgi:hypothetical protein